MINLSTITFFPAGPRKITLSSTPGKLTKILLPRQRHAVHLQPEGADVRVIWAGAAETLTLTDGGDAPSGVGHLVSDGRLYPIPIGGSRAGAARQLWLVSDTASAVVQLSLHEADVR